MPRFFASAALVLGTFALALTGSAGSAQATGLAGTQHAAQVLYATALDWDAGNGAVYVYHAYSKNTSPIRQIDFTTGFPDAVWTDARGHVFVGVVNAGPNGHGYINEYMPGGRTLVQTYAGDLNGPSGGTFDAAGNMYVANLCPPNLNFSCSVFARTGNPVRSVARATGPSQQTSGYIGVYAPGATEPTKILQAPVLNLPVSVAVDRAGRVFAGNNTGQANWNVVEFPAGGRPAKVAPLHGLPVNTWIGTLTFDAAGDLVVGTNEAVDFFARERGNPTFQLTQGLFVPDGIAFGPDGTLFAGNYEFEQNEGNILAFPAGSQTAPRSYAVPYGNGVIAVAVGAAR